MALSLSLPLSLKLSPRRRGVRKRTTEKERERENGTRLSAVKGLAELGSTERREFESEKEKESCRSCACTISINAAERSAPRADKSQVLRRDHLEAPSALACRLSTLLLTIKAARQLLMSHPSVRVMAKNKNRLQLSVISDHHFDGHHFFSPPFSHRPETRAHTDRPTTVAL